MDVLLIERFIALFGSTAGRTARTAAGRLGCCPTSNRPFVVAQFKTQYAPTKPQAAARPAEALQRLISSNVNVSLMSLLPLVCFRCITVAAGPSPPTHTNPHSYTTASAFHSPPPAGGYGNRGSSYGGYGGPPGTEERRAEALVGQSPYAASPRGGQPYFSAQQQGACVCVRVTIARPTAQGSMHPPSPARSHTCTAQTRTAPPIPCNKATAT